MKDYSILRNKVYLYLLAFYDKDKMPSYVKLSEQVGMTRQTVSTRIKELIENDLITVDDNKIICVNNFLSLDVVILRQYLNQNKDFDPIQLREILFGNASTQKVRLELKMAKGTAYKDIHHVVYGIIYEGKLKYVGTTKGLKQRIAQHIYKRPYLTEENFVVLIDGGSYQEEKMLICLLNPEWNQVV